MKTLTTDSQAIVAALEPPPPKKGPKSHRCQIL